VLSTSVSDLAGCKFSGGLDVALAGSSGGLDVARAPTAHTLIWLPIVPVVVVAWVPADVAVVEFIWAITVPLSLMSNDATLEGPGS
jgi:hypothetical protein